MTQNLDIDYNEDIDVLLEKLEDIRLEKDNFALLTAFVDKYAYPVSTLLEELKKRRTAARRQGVEGGGRLGTHRIILEGYSENSIQEAFSNALEKAYSYFSALHDVSVTVLELTHMRSGGHRAMIELNITPMSFRETHKRVGADVERKRNNVKGDKGFTRQRQEHVAHLLHDHFISIQEPSIPDYMLVGVNDAQLLNLMVENDFFDASHKKSRHKDMELNEFIVRVNRPEPEND